MNIKLVEDLEQLLTEDVFSIYQKCMYNSTYEAYKAKIMEYAGDKNTKINICFLNNEIIGIVVLKLDGSQSAEVMGIAVSDRYQKLGVGSFIIKESAKKMNLCQISAETDDDAVGFYKKLGFDITKEIKEYENRRVVRYYCLLVL